MLGRTFGPGFLLLLFFICQCSFCIHICFSTSSLTLPWTITRFLDPIHTLGPAHRRVIRDTFIFNHSVIFLPRALRFWVGIFYPQAFFTLRFFPIFWLNLFLSRLPWEPGSRQLFLEICRTLNWSSKHRPSPFVCLIYSNPQSFIYLKFVFMHVNIAKVLLVVKTLIRSAAKRFSSHENIKQQHCRT